MYGNFIYFILVLLVYSTYVPPQETYLDRFESAVLFLVLLWFFGLSTKNVFSKLARKINHQGPYGLHGYFDRVFTRQAIVAIVLFIVDVYVLNLKLIVMDIPIISASPTAMAVLFVLLFVGHLAIIWFFAYKPYRLLFGTKVTKWTYVRSNISFNLPVILPWFLISLFTDILMHLPFETPTRVLESPEGQVVFLCVSSASLSLLRRLSLRHSGSVVPWRLALREKRLSLYVVVPVWDIATS